MDNRSKRSLSDNIDWNENATARYADSNITTAYFGYEASLKATIELAQSLLAVWQNTGVVAVGLADVRDAAATAAQYGAVLNTIEPLLSQVDRTTFRNRAAAAHGRGPLAEKERRDREAAEKKIGDDR